jgi:hypothetical protein
MSPSISSRVNDNTPLPTINNDCRTAPGSINTSPSSYDFSLSFAAITDRSSGVNVAKIATSLSSLSTPVLLFRESPSATGPFCGDARSMSAAARCR